MGQLDEATRNAIFSADDLAWLTTELLMRNNTQASWRKRH